MGGLKGVAKSGLREKTSSLTEKQGGSIAEREAGGLPSGLLVWSGLLAFRLSFRLVWPSVWLFGIMLYYAKQCPCFVWPSVWSAGLLWSSAFCLLPSAVLAFSVCPSAVRSAGLLCALLVWSALVCGVLPC